MSQQYLLCERCKDDLHLHEEDVSNGYQERRVHIPKARCPPDLQVVITTKDEHGVSREFIPVDQLKCDGCNQFIKDGAPCVAVTHWRGVVEPERWDKEYAQEEDTKG